MLTRLNMPSIRLLAECIISVDFRFKPLAQKITCSIQRPMDFNRFVPASRYFPLIPIR